MSSCFRLTPSFPKRIFFFNKSYFSKNFSILSSKQERLINKNYSKYYTLKIINNLNSVSKRSFSLQPIQNLYNSIGSSSVCTSVKEILFEVHDFTGFSWIVVIIGASAALKLFIAFPCAIYQRLLASKIESTEIELAAFSETLKPKIRSKAIKEQWTPKKIKTEFMKEILKQRRFLFVKNNCHPFKMVILFLIQLPFWLLLSMAIRAIAVDCHKKQSGSKENISRHEIDGVFDVADYSIAALQFQVGGPFWSPNLALPDPTYTIPTINCLAMLACTELSFVSKTSERIPSKKAEFLLKKIIPNFLRIFTVIFFFISAAAPSGLSLFWASNSSIALIQNLILSPKVRRFFKISKISSESDKPHSQAWNKFLEKFR